MVSRTSEYIRLFDSSLPFMSTGFITVMTRDGPFVGFVKVMRGLSSLRLDVDNLSEGSTGKVG